MLAYHLEAPEKFFLADFLFSSSFFLLNPNRSIDGRKDKRENGFFVLLLLRLGGSSSLAFLFYFSFFLASG